MINKYEEREKYARLCRYAYDSKSCDLGSDFTFLHAVTILEIRFCYFKDREGCKYLAIRGTDNSTNQICDAIMAGGLSFFQASLPGKLVAIFGGKKLMDQTFYTAVNGALLVFEREFGECTAATGHSLGGKILEYLPERIQCVAFNAFFNEDRRNISSVRVHNDVAGPHTDHWIGNPNQTSPIVAHSLDTMIDELESKRDYSQKPVLPSPLPIVVKAAGCSVQ